MKKKISPVTITLILLMFLPAASLAGKKRGARNARFISEPTTPIDLGIVARDTNL